MYVPDRGHAVLMNINPRAGHDLVCPCSALVISPSSYNVWTGFLLCCPIASRIRGYPFEVRIEGNPLIFGAALADQVKNLDWRVRGVKFVTAVDDCVLEEVVAKFETLLRSE
jgi:mRNA interferase MazF